MSDFTDLSVIVAAVFLGAVTVFCFVLVVWVMWSLYWYRRNMMDLAQEREAQRRRKLLRLVVNNKPKTPSEPSKGTDL